MNLYLPIAELSVNVFLLLGMGGGVGFCPACSVSAAVF